MASINLDYTSRDFDGLKASMLDYAARNWPAWTGRNEADMGVMLVELFAYMGDVMSYYGDRIANEAFINTATQRQSVLNLAALLGYIPAGRTPATATITFSNSSGSAVIVPAGTQVMTDSVAQIDSPVFFETDYDLSVPGNSNATVSMTEGRSAGSVPIVLHPGTSIEEDLNVEIMGTADGSIDSEFTVSNYPVIDGSIRVFGDETDPNSSELYEEYQQYDFILDAGPSDRAFSFTRDASGIVSITFGDGLNGFVPPAGTQVYVFYRVGNGSLGNVQANSITDIATSVANINIVSNTAATGGADEEDIDQIRVNAPRAYQTQARAVTLADYGNLALGVSSVYKASAVANTYSSVSVFILGPGGQPPNQALLDAAKAYLDDRKMAGTTVSVLAGSQIAVNLGTSIAPVIIGVMDRFVRTDVKNAVTQALTNYFSPANSDFGKRIPLSDIYTVIANVPGVQYANVTMMARNDASQTGTADVLSQPWEIPVLGSLYLTATGGIA